MKIAVAMCRLFPEPYPSNKIYIEALTSRGAEVITPSWNTDSHAAFLECDLIVLRQTWDYQADAAGFASWLSAIQLSGGRIANSPAAAIWNNDKRSLAWLGERGFAIPKTADLESIPLETAKATIGGERFVIKPAYGGGGYGVRLARAHELAEVVDAASAEVPGRPMMLQEYLPEIADGEWDLTYIGGQLSHAVHKVPAQGEFRINNQFKPSVGRAVPPKFVIDTAVAILASIPTPLLYARIDGIVRDETFICTEVELTDPDLHFEYCPEAADLLAKRTLLWCSEVDTSRG